METLFTIFAPVILFASSVMHFGVTTDTTIIQPVLAQQNQISVELDLQELSPRGESGGFAMPASGCSAADPNPVWHGYPIHDCVNPLFFPKISVDKPIVRSGNPVTVSWDPKAHRYCVLSANLASLSPVPDGTVVGSVIINLLGETSYSIVCEGGYSDSVTVKILPRIQET